MKRIVKDPEIRRFEIINAAQRLFEREGYTKTTVETIINEAGIAKGTFYYYFKTKQDILRAIVENIVSKLKAHFELILEDKKLTVIEKLKEMIVGSQKKETINAIVMEIVHLPENRELQEELNIQAVNTISPIIFKVFEKGYKEGVFKKTITLECVQILLAGSQFVLDSGLFKWSSEKRTALLNAIQFILESTLEVKAGTLNFISEKS